MTHASDKWRKLTHLPRCPTASLSPPRGQPCHSLGFMC